MAERGGKGESTDPNRPQKAVTTGRDGGNPQTMTATEMFDTGPARRKAPWGTAASVGLHLVLLAGVVVLSPLRPLDVPPPRPVTVEIVTPAQFAALDTAATPVPQLTTPSAAEPAAPTAPGEERLPSEPRYAPPVPKTFRATRFYAAGILEEPGMEHIRATLGRIAPAERIVQLCNIEGLEQIRRAAPQYDPDTLVSYAMADTSLAGLTLTATGGAFRSRRKWYAIALKCTVGADFKSVTAFEFKLGQPIPRSEWEDHDLNDEDTDE